MQHRANSKNLVSVDYENHQKIKGIFEEKSVNMTCIRYIGLTLNSILAIVDKWFSKSGWLIIKSLKKTTKR